MGGGGGAFRDKSCGIIKELDEHQWAAAGLCPGCLQTVVVEKVSHVSSTLQTQTHTHTRAGLMRLKTCDQSMPMVIEGILIKTKTQKSSI